MQKEHRKEVYPKQKEDVKKKQGSTHSLFREKGKAGKAEGQGGDAGEQTGTGSNRLEMHYEDQNCRYNFKCISSGRCTKTNIPRTSQHRRTGNVFTYSIKKRRRPTLPLMRSTIGADGLNFSVRNGKRWEPRRYDRLNNETWHDDKSNTTLLL